MSRLLKAMEVEGSTRAIGLLRIGLALLLWACWANELMPYRWQEPRYWLAGAAFYLGTTAMLVGFWTRISTAFTAVVVGVLVFGFGYYDGQHAWIHHHTHLLAHATILLALTPCGRSFSLDRWLARRRGWVAPEVGPLWAVPLLALQASAVYFFSAIDKTTLRFLSGDHLRGIVAVYYTGSDPIDLPGFDVLLVLASVGVVALEYVLPFALFVPRLRRWAVPVGLVLHGLFYVLLPVGTFSLTMIVLYLAYLDPSAVHRAIDRLLAADALPDSA